MPKPKRKLTTAQRKARKKRRREPEIIFVNGRQKRVRRQPEVQGKAVDEFIRRNADPVWLHQNEMRERVEDPKNSPPPRPDVSIGPDDDIPF